MVAVCLPEALIAATVNQFRVAGQLIQHLAAGMSMFPTHQAQAGQATITTNSARDLKSNLEIPCHRRPAGSTASAGLFADTSLHSTTEEDSGRSTNHPFATRRNR